MSARIFIHYYLAALLVAAFCALLAEAVWLQLLRGALLAFLAMWTPLALFLVWKNVESARELARRRR